tara:strand:+ start:198 stop:473 length:276 start_codon:yes stop_codon:yes gene_type:complete
VEIIWFVLVWIVFPALIFGASMLVCIFLFTLFNMLFGLSKWLSSPAKKDVFVYFDDQGKAITSNEVARKAIMVIGFLDMLLYLVAIAPTII